MKFQFIWQKFTRLHGGSENWVYKCPSRPLRHICLTINYLVCLFNVLCCVAETRCTKSLLGSILQLLKEGVSYASVMAEKPVTTGNNDELAPVWQTARSKRPKPALKPAAKPAASKLAAKRPAATSRNIVELPAVCDPW